MRVLIVGEFDPTGYALRYRDWLGRIGVEVKTAVRDIWRAEWAGHDWIVGQGQTQGLREYAASCDVVILCPVIGQVWSCREGEFHAHPEPDEDGMFPIDWGAVKHKVVLCHGSAILHQHAERYADLYRGKGWTVAATTLDYRQRMDALYLRPVVDLEGCAPAELRLPGAMLMVVHTPTAMNEGLYFSRAFVEMAGRLQGVTPAVFSGMSHRKILRIKAGFDAAFDHLRGSFSINSLENAGLGLVNLVGLRPEYREWMRANLGTAPDWPHVENMGDVHDWIVRLRDDVKQCRRWQERGRRWFLEHWQPLDVARDVAKTLETIVSGGCA